MKKILPIIIAIIMLSTFAFAVDTSGANAPEVYQGLYPIKLNSDGSVNLKNGDKINILSASNPDWYNYSEGKWANAVTLDKIGQMNPSAATVDNITGYYVWIPRYAYLIRTGYNTADTGRIDIRFLSGATNKDQNNKEYFTVENIGNTAQKWEKVNGVTYVGDRQMEYLVHPAFRFEEELTGIWVGKYESRKGTGIYENAVNIKQDTPVGVLWSSIDINSSMEESRELVSKAERYDPYNLYGFGENVNTHLAKPTEYGAVVYLNNSIYEAKEGYGVEEINSGKEYLAGGLQGSIGATDDKYLDVYGKDGEGNIVDVKGSAYLETSKEGQAWNNEEITGNGGVLVKTGAYGIEAGDGQATDVGFRVVLTKGSNENKIKEVYISSGDTYYWLMENGDVWVMGDNTYGQLGLGDTNKRNIPVRLIKDNKGRNIVGIEKIICSGYTVYYLDKEGGLYVSGDNPSGQLGVGTRSNVETITKVESGKDTDGNDIVLPAIDRVIIDAFHTHYLDKEGGLYVSGENEYGKLGVGTTTYVETITKVERGKDSNGNAIVLPAIDKVITYIETTYYIDKEGGLYVSGYNEDGKLGIDTIDEYVYTITKVDWLGDIKCKDVSGRHIITEDNNIYFNKFLRDAINIKNTKMDKVISERYSTTYYLDEEGGLYVSGKNNYGQLGVGTTTNVDKITKVERGKDVAGNAIVLLAIDKVISYGTNTYYLDEEGGLYVSGYNNYGQLGVGTTSNVNTITKVESGKDADENLIVLPAIDKVISNGSSIYYLDKEGGLYVSGRNNYGQLGVGTTSDINTITKVERGEDEDGNAIVLPAIDEVISNGSSTYYLDKEGRLYVSGRNNSGQLGVGTTSDVNTITKVERGKDKDENPIVLPAIDKVISNGSSTYYLDKEGGLYVSGENMRGQLGLGTTSRTVATIIKVESGEDADGNAIVLPAIDKVISNASSTYYLDKEGGLYVSGYNNSGQLGVGTKTNVETITKVESGKDQDENAIVLPEIDKVISDGYDTYYLDKEGGLYVSGRNRVGQLGVGTTQTNVETITKIERGNDKDGNAIVLPAMDKVISDGDNTYYLDKEGGLYVSGKNGYDGQLGVGTTSNVNTITKVESGKDADENLIVLPAIDKVISNGSSTYYLDKKGRLYVSGDNNYGQLGIGNTIDRTQITAVQEEDTSYSPLGNIAAIYGNSTSTIFEEDDGDVYVIGDNMNNKLGTTGTIKVAKKINLKGIKDAGVGDDFSVFLKDDGSVVGYGNTSKNGNGLTDIAQIAVGKNHAVFLTKSGTIVNKGTTTSAHVTGVNGIHKIVAGDNHTVVLKKDGTTKSFGQSDSGLTNVVDIFAGKNMTIYITNDGKVYMVNNNSIPIAIDTLKDIVYGDLSGSKAYFITKDRELVDINGEKIELLGSELQWVKSVKGDVVLSERMRVYDLSKV